MDILTYRRIILKVVSTNQYGPNKKAFVQKKRKMQKKSKSDQEGGERLKKRI